MGHVDRPSSSARQPKDCEHGPDCVVLACHLDDESEPALLTGGESSTSPDGVVLAHKYGFPPALMEEVDRIYPGNAGECGMCGDTILGGRHRVLDAIAERLRVGEFDAGDDYDIPAGELWIVVMASYEHDKALARQRRAERKAVAS